MGRCLEAYLLYSSIALICMASAALLLFVIFSKRLRSINRFDSHVKAEVYSRSFVVFSPYSEVTVFHRFLLLAIVAVWYCCFLFLYVFFKALEYGLLLPFILVVVCLNMLPLEVAFEVYKSSSSFVEAMQGGFKFGVGDIEVLKSLKKTLRKISNYCLVLSVIFFVSALLFPVFWSQLLSSLESALSFFDVFIPLGVFGTQVLILLAAIIFVIICFLGSFVKKRLLYE